MTKEKTISEAAKAQKKNRRKNLRLRQEIEERLLKGERVMKVAYIHPGIYWKSFVVLIFALFLALYIFELGILLGVFGILMFLHATALRQILLLVVTNKRIIARYGILQVDFVDLHFDRIESVELERMLPGYMMGYANVVLMGTGNRYLVIPFVGNPIDIRRVYNEQTLAEE